MAKRPVHDVDESDDEVEVTSPRNAKRVRINGDDHPETGQKQVTRTQKDSDDEDYEEDGQEGTGRKHKKLSDEQLQQIQADRDFEEKIDRNIQEALLGRVRQGGIADMGIIQTLYMENFMCHARLHFKFGPQINFIIGHNGSGKSAVLTALTVALGGKATATNRANNLKSLIKEGEQYSEVSVTLKNKGTDAYCPEVYGDSITITRRFTVDGSSSYKIRGANSDKIISTKREELTAICDHMNIQVDNPMNVLTQDTARQFLSASKPKDKYAFFLRGTQLLHLSMEYETIRENLKRTVNVIQQKAEVIPELIKEHDEASVRWKEAEAARDQQRRLEELKQEKAWSLVDGKAKEHAKQQVIVDQADRVLPELRERLAEAEARLLVHTEELTRSEAAVREEEAAAQPLEDEKRRINALIKEKKSQVRVYINEENQMNQQLRGINFMIAGVEKQIEDETRKLAADSREKHEQHQVLLADGKAKVDECRQAVAQNFREQEEARANAAKARQDMDNAIKERDRLRNQMNDMRSQIQHIQSLTNYSMAGFGNGIPQLLNLIRQEKWYGETPVGPLGMFVELKDSYRNYATLLRVVLGGHMRSFAITDSRDRTKLKTLLARSSNADAQIIISQRDIFEYSHAEPPPEVHTMLRALVIKDEFVLRLLINSNSIERAVLAPTRVEAEQTVKRHGIYGSAFSADGFRFTRYNDGGENSSPLPPLPGKDSRNHLFQKSPEQSILALKAEGAAAEERHRVVVQDAARFRSDMEKFSREHDRLKQAGPKLEAAVRAAQSDLEKIQMDMQQDEPASMDAFQASLREQQGEKESILNQFRETTEAKATAQAELPPLVAEVEELNTRMSTYEQRKEEHRAAAVKAAEVRLKAQRDKAHYEKKLEEESAKVDKYTAVLNTLKQELQMWTEQVQESYERPARVRKTETVDKEIKGIERVLKEREARDGATLEDIELDLKKAKMALDAAKRDHDGMVKLHRTLKSALEARMEKWHDFRRHIAVRAKHQFQFHLSKRAYFGKLDFNHVLNTLELKVQTEDQIGTQTKREKDPRALSGGEKSFSTICLLLSLWEAISCPIRCLDEFDVFMDAVNRRISMTMITSTAKQDAGTQYILITPQDMSNISLGPEVRVHRMSDPERGQGQLPFAS